MKKVIPLLAALLAVGCIPANSLAPRQTSRAAVLMVAQAFVELDHACAAAAFKKDDAALAGKCADAYDVARVDLMFAASAIDTWNEAESPGKTSCALLGAARQLSMVADVVKANSGKVPPVVSDASAVLATLGTCKQENLQ